MNEQNEINESDDGSKRSIEVTRFRSNATQAHAEYWEGFVYAAVPSI